MSQPRPISTTPPPQTSSIKINSQLVKKIKLFLQTNPTADQSKVIDAMVSDSTLRLKRQIIKSGVNQYWRKYLTKPPTITIQPTNTLSLNNNNTPKQPIDLTILQTMKKKIKKNQQQQSFQFEDNQSYKLSSLAGMNQVISTLQSTLFQHVNNKVLYNQITKHQQQLNTNNNNKSTTTTSSTIKGYLISGSVGSGKTLLSNIILSQLKLKQYTCYFINSLQLLNNDADQKIKKIFQAMQENSPSALCIDNIEQLCSKQQNKRPQGSCINTLCINIDKSINKDFIFIATTSAPEKLDILTKPGRFYKLIKINNPTEQQRIEMLTKILQSYQNTLTQTDIKQVIKLTSGYVVVDLVSFCQQAMTKCVKRIIKSIQSPKSLILEDFINASQFVSPVLKRQGFAKIPTTSLNDIGALQHIKQALINQIILPMRSKDKFKKLGYQISGGGVLLYGPPGCGKTMLAKGIANQANVNFITVKGPQLLTKYVGQSEQAVRKVFQRARSCAPSVIFFDQFDALAPKRQDSGNQVTQRVVNTLLNQLNGIDDRNMIFVIAATNRPDIIDQAVLRSGRIQLKLQVPMPSQADREKILQKLTLKVCKQQQIDIKLIATKAQKFSGADLAYLVKKSIISAVATNRDGISNKDMLNAIQSFAKDNVFGKKPQMIQQQEQKQDEEFAYHPQEELKPKNMLSGQSQGVDNELQKNIRPKQKLQAESVLNEFINFLVQKKSSNNSNNSNNKQVRNGMSKK